MTLRMLQGHEGRRDVWKKFKVRLKSPPLYIKDMQVGFFDGPSLMNGGKCGTRAFL